MLVPTARSRVAVRVAVEAYVIPPQSPLLSLG